MSLTTAAHERRLPPERGKATIRHVYSNVSDGELITRVGSGDRTAFDTLYRRYARPVFGLALRRLGDRGRAEDAVQETFASIWRAAGSYKPERGPGAPPPHGHVPDARFAHRGREPARSLQPR